MKSTKMDSINKENKEMVTKFWTSGGMYKFCNRHNLYTRGDTFDYSSMLEFVSTNDPTPANVKKVAVDLVIHSENMSYWNDGEITRMVKLINKEVVHKINLEEE